tara:strand:- start:558 stop:929 length:372 start_codon:yes stop_codon:yes gene_type:complete
MFEESGHIINLSLNKENIDFYRRNDKIVMKKGLVTNSFMRGIKIIDNKITTQIILDDKYFYLPDIEYSNDKDLLVAVINRDKYIELLANKCSDKDKIIDILRKKNLPFQCTDNTTITNILNNI